jgi:hypothetical protein
LLRRPPSFLDWSLSVILTGLYLGLRCFLAGLRLFSPGSQIFCEDLILSKWASVLALLPFMSSLNFFRLASAFFPVQFHFFLTGQQTLHQQFFLNLAWTFRTMLWHKRPLSIMHDILSPTNLTFLTNDMILLWMINLFLIHDSHSIYVEKYVFCC